MQKKLTITIDEEVYDGLHKTIGPRNPADSLHWRLIFVMGHGN